MTRIRTNPKNTTRGPGRASAAAAVCCAALTLSSDGARAQQDPTSIGAGQKPFVMVIVDTSASMEFSQEGETRYACYGKDPDSADAKTCDASRDNNAFPPRGGADKTVFEWGPSQTLTESVFDPGDPDDPTDDRTWNDPENFVNGGDEVREYIGPCRTWVPSCNNYERPPWLPEARGDLLQAGHTKNYYRDQTDDMRGTRAADGSFTRANSGRLSNFNQPRHVQVKELLTGDMVLRPSGAVPDDRALSADLYGPGCFFVPRMFGVRSNKDAYRICHDEVLIDPNDKDKGTRLVRQGGTEFPDFVDHNDPRPHIQEVYDFQRRNGLLDNLSNVAIFSVAMFDGYQGKDPFTAPPGAWDLDGTFVDGSAGDDIEDGQGYNLGVYRIVGPSVALHEIETTSLAPLSTFSQMAITDAGFLSLGERKALEVTGGNTNTLGLSFPPNFDALVEPYQLGKQPIAKSTPLAAAIHDVHMFFKHGQHGFDRNGEVDTSRSFNPIGDDAFYQCRGKHVLLLTDGYPEPEAFDASFPDGGIGNERLNSNYGYNSPDEYRYELAEEEVSSFVGFANAPFVGTEVENSKFLTRVHVVGLNTERGLGPDLTADKEQQVRRKMGLMASNGNTCAVYYLSKSAEGRAYIPGTLDISEWSVDPGTCDEANGENCLVVQFPDKATAPEYDTGEDDGAGSIATIKCQSPALILSRNDQAFDRNEELNESGDNREFRDELAFALQIVFNEVIDATGGVASRTRAAVTNSVAIDGDRGQYRVYSGAEVSAGSIYWKGLLNREPYLCSNGGEPELAENCVDGLDNEASCLRPLHRDVASQVEEVGGTWVDNRRLFTALPELGADPINAPELMDTGDALFPTTYALMSASDSASNNLAADTFGDTNLINPANSEYLVGKRIPYRAPELREAIANMGVPVGDVDSYLFGGSSGGDTDRVVASVRGRQDEKRGQPLNAILNSNPSIVGPPSLDLPIASYRDFRDLYRNRATMLYVSTLDGVLHAIHAGEQDGRLEVAVREMSAGKGTESIGEVVSSGAGDVRKSQREAWGYVPDILRLELFPNLERQPNLLDGSPVIKDVRLCDASPARNFNEQACGVVSDDPNTSLPGAMQWRTVLVQGLGQAGAGYFAMDVTRSGGPIADGSNAGSILTTDPDPVPLWEFDAAWERRQVEGMALPLVGLDEAPDGVSLGLCESTPGGGCTGESFYRDAFMGVSTGDPAIGTVVLKGSGADGVMFQRPVAIFGAGRVMDGSNAAKAGRAIYVVDLQTGSLLRRFVSYTSDGGGARTFEYEVSGTPALFNDRVGSVTNRGFIGDSGGRLFRLDMSSPEPSLWQVTLMYDPCKNDDFKARAEALNLVRATPLDDGCGIPDGPLAHVDPPTRAVGPADFPPAVALDASRRVVVTYGLGDRTDTTSSGTVQAIIAVEDPYDDGFGGERFMYAFEDGEKLTGAPTIFNDGSYFTTYFTDPEDACAPGTSRIYGLDFEVQGLFLDDTSALVGKFDAEGPQFDDPAILNSGESGTTGTYLWVGPKEPSLIRGLTIAFDVDCSGDPNGPAGSFTEDGDPPQPTLIAQIGGVEPPPKIGKGSAGADGAARLEIKLEAGKSRAVPLSWGVVGF